MSEKKISYLNRDFEDYQSALKDFIDKYYPQISNDFNDASIGSWLIDIVAAIGDNLSYHIDRTYGETNIDTAQQSNSVYSLARSNGLKVPGAKGSIAEVTFSCTLPSYTSQENDGSTTYYPNWALAPTIKRGTLVTSTSQIFELMEDVNFAENFNNNGEEDRAFTPNSTDGTIINSYTITKKATVTAGSSKIYTQTLSSSDIKPFMEVTIPDTDIMEVESIIFKVGTDYNYTPYMSEFFTQNEYVSASDSITDTETYRYFEVNNFTQSYRWGDDLSNYTEGNQIEGIGKTYKYAFQDENGENQEVFSITKGQWIPISQKFITEFTDKGYLKVIFGSGSDSGQEIPEDVTDFSKYLMSRMVNNNFMGKLPQAGWTMFVLYRVGGGTDSNVAAGAINSFSSSNIEICENNLSDNDKELVSGVRNSISVTNEQPSVCGKDAPTTDEIKNMIKYNNAANERCVTLKDYEYRVQSMPPRYGCPFRVTATEGNNKVMIYILGLDSEGKLSISIPDILKNNIANYLSRYRSINDFVEIKNGRIINIGVEVTAYYNKNYDKKGVTNDIKNKIEEYMDINAHFMGEEVFIGDLMKEIGNIDGVINLSEIRVFNKFGDNYSSTQTSQETVDVTENEVSETTSDTELEIDLKESDYILYNEYDSMFEIKYPDNDIVINLKTR